MDPGYRSNISPQCLEGLSHRGLLRPLTATEEWRLPGEEEEPQPPEGYVVSFAHFHERGFTMLAHQFFQGLLDYYQLELQHLTPNGIQHIAAFVALCEGFLGINPHFDLWRYLFVKGPRMSPRGPLPSRPPSPVDRHQGVAAAW